MAKLYKCYLSQSAEDTTTGTMMLTKKEYELVKRVANYSNWDNCIESDWCGSLDIYCPELNKEDAEYLKDRSDWDE